MQWQNQVIYEKYTCFQILGIIKTCKAENCQSKNFKNVTDLFCTFVLGVGWEYNSSPNFDIKLWYQLCLDIFSNPNHVKTLLIQMANWVILKATQYLITKNIGLQSLSHWLSAFFLSFLLISWKTLVGSINTQLWCAHAEDVTN